MPDKPLRSQKDLLKATRSPAGSHFLTERDKAKRKPAENPTTDFILSASSYISWAYHYLRSRFGPRYRPRTYPTASGNTGVYRMADDGPVRIGMAADWGSYTAEAAKVMQQLASHDPHYTIHLGDIYYTGIPAEVRENFEGGDCCWHYGSIGTYALPGNHEMYCNGKGYFVTLLGALRRRYPLSTQVQGSSYFCLENKHWRIIGLDTGRHSIGFPVLEYIFEPQTYIERKAITWLEKYVFNDKSDKRGLIILSHHQVLSAFENGFPKQAIQLGKLIPKEKTVLWLWGHEHRFAMYNAARAAPGAVQAWGRCIGHGSMPASIAAPNPAKPGTQYLEHYDNRVMHTYGSTPVGFNGFVNLTLNGPEAALQYIDLNGQLQAAETFTVDMVDGSLMRSRMAD